MKLLMKLLVVILPILFNIGCGVGGFKVEQYNTTIKGEATVGLQGVPGETGKQGVSGPTGADGHSIVSGIVSANTEQCSNGGSVLLFATDVNDNGVIDNEDTGIQSSIICNGVNGQDGVTPKFTPVAPIAACGNLVPFKEQLLCLSGGQVLASFSDNISGLNTRFAFLSDGNYMNSDGSGCQFSVQIQSDSSTLVSWSGGSFLCQSN